MADLEQQTESVAGYQKKLQKDMDLQSDVIERLNFSQ